MKSEAFWAAAGKALAVAIVTLIVILMFDSNVWAQSNYKVLYRFKGPASDGNVPNGGLIFDSAGNLYGAAAYGYNSSCNWYGCGGVFQLTQKPNGKWEESLLYSFTGSADDGGVPGGPLVFDAAGNLYSYTAQNGQCGYGGSCGTIFKLAPNPDGSWTKSVILSYTDDRRPNPLIIDAAGNLYGTSYFGGDYGYGTVFQLVPNQDGTWTEKILQSFGYGFYGTFPHSGLMFDHDGNLYGTTQYGGSSRGCGGWACGTVFRLTPNADGSWTESVLHDFADGAHGANPEARLIVDAAGNLYGTTAVGGAYGYGNVFKLRPHADGSWTLKVLHQFKGGADGANPYAGLTLDAAGVLYGTTFWGGVGPCSNSYGSGCGTVFKLTHSSGGWKKTTLRRFRIQPNGNPAAELIFDASGNLYGTATGGTLNCWYMHDACGIAYQITP